MGKIDSISKKTTNYLIKHACSTYFWYTSPYCCNMMSTRAITGVGLATGLSFFVWRPAIT